MENSDGMSIDDKFSILSMDSAMEAAMSRVVFKHVRLKLRHTTLSQCSLLGQVSRTLEGSVIC